MAQRRKLSEAKKFFAQKKRTRKEYEEYLNELGDDVGDALPERRMNGGRMPNKSKYGTWMKTHDPIAFNVGYNEFVQERRKD